jgi:hypothetical protein
MDCTREWDIHSQVASYVTLIINNSTQDTLTLAHFALILSAPVAI